MTISRRNFTRLAATGSAVAVASRNPKALTRLVAAGAQLVVLSPDTLKALHTALEQVLDEESAKSEQFKRICENWRAFRAEQNRWFSIADARTEMSVYSRTTAGQNL
jgi:TRAP-type mannitol/chloroaromatic compound transport system substrate-binding protein